MSALVRHRLVILHPSEVAVLVIGSETARGLPEVALPERHTADVEHLNSAVRERWGLLTTVLCGIESSTTEASLQTHVLEVHQSGDRLKSLEPHGSAAWLAIDEAVELSLSHDDRSLVRRGQQAIEGPVPDGCGWMRRDWWPAVSAWIETHIGDAEVVQTRAWRSSCVARVRPRPREVSANSRPGFFFKALPTSGEVEARITAYLSRRHAIGAPPVEAVDLDRSWLLMRAFDGTSLDITRDPGPWERAVATFGQLQASVLDRSDELRELGLTERRLEDLAAAVEALLADSAALLPGDPDGLSHDQIEAVRRLGPELQQSCEKLADLGISLVLDHGDLWPSNVLVNASGCVIIDWEDACLNQPFFSLAPLLAMLREWHVPLSPARVADAYLKAFPTSETKRLNEALHLAMPLGFLDMAVRYWRIAALYSALHPWMRGMVPFFLRQLLSTHQ